MKEKIMRTTTNSNIGKANSNAGHNQAAKTGNTEIAFGKASELLPRTISYAKVVCHDQLIAQNCVSAEEFLSRAVWIQKQIATQKEILPTTEELATQISAVISGMPHNPYGGTSSVERALLRCEKAAEDIENTITYLACVQDEVMDLISHVSDVKSRTVLEYLYIQHMSIKDAGKAMDRTSGWVVRKRDAGFTELDALLESVWKEYKKEIEENNRNTGKDNETNTESMTDRDDVDPDDDYYGDYYDDGYEECFRDSDWDYYGESGIAAEFGDGADSDCFDDGDNDDADGSFDRNTKDEEKTDIEYQRKPQFDTALKDYIAPTLAFIETVA